MVSQLPAEVNTAAVKHRCAFPREADTLAGVHPGLGPTRPVPHRGTSAGADVHSPVERPS